MEIGDKVTVIDPGELYSTYSLWVERFASQYLPYWKNGRQFPVNNLKDIQFTVVAKHPHEEISDMIYLIQAPDKKVYLVSELGIKKINNINILDLVDIMDEQYVYTEYETWIRDNAPTYLENWKQGSLPNTSKRFEVVGKGPKANFPPFDEIPLYLVQEQSSPYQVFIVEKRGLQRK